MPKHRIAPRTSSRAALLGFSFMASLMLAGFSHVSVASAGTPMISAGLNHSCGVTVSGEGLCWGDNTKGQRTVPTGKTWASISADSSSVNDSAAAFSCGVTTTGGGFCWGSNSKGQRTVPTGNTWASISAGGLHACGVTTTAAGLCWGANNYGSRTVPTGNTWASISAGYDFSCGVTTSGTGLCWGYSFYGQTSVPSDKIWASISAGQKHACGVTTSGEGLCWGSNSWGNTTVPTGKTWASLVAGDQTSCGVTTSGQGICWGWNGYGQTTVPTGKTWAAIDLGIYHTCGLTTTGQGLCWGWDGSDPGFMYYGYLSGVVASDGRLAVPSDKFAAGSVVVDTTAPDAPVLSGAPSATTNELTASISFTAEANATFTCSVDGGSYAACTSPKSMSGLAAGAHSLDVKATDSAGNTSTAGSAAWTVQSLGTSSPSLQSGSVAVGKPNVIQGGGHGLTGAVGTPPSAVFQWQRCTTLSDASSCSAITGVAGAAGAWWGTRDADIGYQLRLSVSWDTVQGVKNALSALSGLVAPSVTSVPTIMFGVNPVSRAADTFPVKGVGQHSSFGVWDGYIAGVSFVAFEWQTCSSGTDLSTCAASATSRNSQWYTPTAADVGKYLRTKATITTRGQTAVGYSAVSNVHATRSLLRQTRASRRVAARSALACHGKAHTAARVRAHAAC